MKNQNKKEDKANNLNEQTTNPENVSMDNNVCEENNGNSEECTFNENQDFAAMKIQLKEKTKKCEEYMGMAQRMAAEFDNYKKRTAKEKEALYSDTVGEVISALLPVVDNFERAILAAGKEDDPNKADVMALKNGIDMVFRQMKDVMKNLGVEEIKCVGEQFDPQLHNAVMHVEDETQGENVVVEEFQKGYMIKEKVIRHSMVKVAN
ncbi:MAG: nucleotide exchange factor GrpE [Clostridia bacterium]|nr:nucleotide exchange factor GrpE [Clostridia bacterium]